LPFERQEDRADPQTGKTKQYFFRSSLAGTEDFFWHARHNRVMRKYMGG
jgi:hypothetical protein